MISTVIMAFVSFASTNIDDLLILMLFFSETNNVIKKRHVVIGQYFALGALTTISIIGSLGIAVIPHEYVGVLGSVPIYLGIKTYVDHKKESNNENIDQQEIENSTHQEITYIQGNSIITFIKSFINPSVIKVFSITLASGGDNIGIYIPLFISMSLLGIVVTVIIFILLTALWCFIGLKLSEYSFVQRYIEKYKHIFVPIIFIGLGFFILIKNETISLICDKMF